ncbi:MAG: glycoside hydrolase, partial [Cellulomonas iranensis]|nr:glycoside hydrolase [Cellulomonas iranensis]
MSDADGTRPAEPAATGPVPAPAPSAPLFAAPSSYRHVARPAAADAPVAHAAPVPGAHPGYAPV